MAREHKISITPQGTLKDLIENIFRGRGTAVRIAGREYTLRESGDLTEQDPMRLNMLTGLENQARIVYGRHSQKIRLGAKKDERREPALKISYIKAEELPGADKDGGTHQYMVVEGVRYKVVIEGDINCFPGLTLTPSQIMEQGREMIYAHRKGHEGKFPNGIDWEFNVERSTQIGPFKFKNKD